MSTSYKAQINNVEGKYEIQFETCNYDYFKIVEKACQKTIDKKDKKGADENDTTGSD